MERHTEPLAKSMGIPTMGHGTTLNEKRKGTYERTDRFILLLDAKIQDRNGEISLMEGREREIK